MVFLINKKIIVACTLGSVGFPIILLFNNGNSGEGNNFLMIPNYNGQADMMLSLQIHPDYYPYQFKQQKLYDYISNSTDYIEGDENVSEEKKELKKELQNRINTLMGKVQKFGPSLWNKDLYDTGTLYRNDQFWSSMKSKYFFAEQFIVDDYMNTFDALNFLPTHEELVITNFRSARDPYSVFNEDTFKFFKKKTDDKNKSTVTSVSSAPPESLASTTNDKFNEELYKYYEKYTGTSPDALYRFSKFIIFWNNLGDSKTQLTGTTATSIDRDNFFTIPIQNEKLFNIFDADIDEKIATQYAKSLFSKQNLEELNRWTKGDANTYTPWSSAYCKSLNINKPKPDVARNKRHLTLQNYHHAALEHQTIAGSSPLAEGSQKELMVYVYQFAKAFHTIAKSSNFDSTFANDSRKDFIKNAFQNAQLIAKNYKERIKNIRSYFKKLKVIDEKYDPDNTTSANWKKTNSKTLAVVTHAPNMLGAGNSSIQSISKFPFIYRDIGFKQVVPDFLKNEHSDDHSHTEEELEGTFSVDDNGWWWNIGNTNLDSNNLQHFKNTSDSVIFLSTQDDWNVLSGENGRKISPLSDLLTTQTPTFKYDYDKINTPQYPLSHQPYNLWNEGLRSPLALNLLLDQLVKIIKRQYHTNSNEHKTEYQKAQDWGNYWSKCFIKNQHNCSTTK